MQVLKHSNTILARRSAPPGVVRLILVLFDWGVRTYLLIAFDFGIKRQIPIPILVA